jgi:O-6-methylguanine DNA methyltransferase
MPTRSNQNGATTFAEAVRRVVRKIPKRQVLTYGEVARRAGYIGAARAVASVMSNNFDPDVPCHRVILKSGQVGEYNRGGSVAKLDLLTQEGWSGTIS